MRKLFAMMLLACITAGANAQEKKPPKTRTKPCLQQSRLTPLQVSKTKTVAELAGHIQR